jgi:protein-S-isoprenylcysteine O-methyltransferase Ste14
MLSQIRNYGSLSEVRGVLFIWLLRLCAGAVLNDRDSGHSRTTPAMPPTSDTVTPAIAAPSVSARGFSQRVFSNRLGVGLLFAVAGVFLARPHTLWGDFRLWGTIGSLALVAAGMLLRFWAAGSAGTHTHSAAIEGPQLATGGPYAFARNPIYLGSIVLGLGMIGLIGDARLLPFHIAAFALLYTIIIPAEERFLGATYGKEYEAYCAAVPRFIPRLWPWPGKTERPFRWEAARGELRLVGVLAGIYIALELGAWARSALAG